MSLKSVMSAPPERSEQLHLSSFPIHVPVLRVDQHEVAFYSDRLSFSQFKNLDWLADSTQDRIIFRCTEMIAGRID
jgi:hypothetical protein